MPQMISPLLIINIVFSALYFIMAMYFLVGWLRLKSPKSEVGDQKTEPFVSIIIPVRNESEHIKDCLESVFKQNYPQHLFEVIVVDDYSTDSTLRLAQEFHQKNLLVLNLKQYLGSSGEDFPNKKKAIALGIKNAKGSLIITTDGDCVAREKWIRSLTKFYMANEFKLVTSPVMMKPAKFPIEIFQQLDVINLVGITGATIRNNFPTMCNGANLMYAKQTFLEVEGFKGNYDVPSGDDIFLMEKINERYPNSIGFLKNFDACVFTKPQRSFSGFISQRVRWASKSSRFVDWKVQAVLYFAYLFNLIILIDCLFTLQMQGKGMSWLPLAVAGGTKLFADFMFSIPLTIFFRKWLLLLLLPLIEVFHVLYVVIIGVFSLRGKYRWKDRRIN